MKRLMAGLLGGVVMACALHAGEPKTNSHAAMKTNRPIERATFGGGCFWCLEAVFERVPGVRAVTSGYAGGHTVNPSYEEVCTGRTGHAEVVQIEYDPAQVSFEQLLDWFWKAHDPTSLNRQGADVGTQYRSVIFYENEGQQLAAEKSKAGAAKRFSKPIVTEIAPLRAFYPAEAYHQDYYRKNPNAAYCQAVIRPKLEQLGPELPSAR
jgi:peptide-methionine (S)-S-oxide reductase